MNQLNLFPNQVWHVLEITNFIRDLLESDETLQSIWVQGEVSNISRPTSGHMYFTLKDGGASLRCVMWRNQVIHQDSLPRDGDAIEVHGSIGVYEMGGQYQLYVDIIRAAGEGALFQEFLRLKTRLENEGLFSMDRKRPIPTLPENIGIVTSPTGAALRDILNVILRRYPLVKVIISPCPVQGEAAPQGIVDAIQSLNIQICPDLIILARGGGAIEDLWAFNDEKVARAIYNSRAPIITGIGHETDFTIADFVADLRAPTPTAAAELATPDQFDLRMGLEALEQRLTNNMKVKIKNSYSSLDLSKSLFYRYTPLNSIKNARQRIDDLNHDVGICFKHQIDLERSHLSGIAQQFEVLSPKATMARGFAVITGSDNRTIRSVKQIKKGSSLTVQISDGNFGVNVENISPK